MTHKNSVTDLSSIRGDEYYTLESDVQIIANNLREDIGRIWCPFDTEESFFPKVLRERGYDVVTSHISTGGDFFTMTPPENVGGVVSNPPFSKKKEVIKRLEWLGMKWCLILPFLMLNDGTPLDYAKQLMLFRHRVFFSINGRELNKPRTTCIVMSNGLLKRDYTVVMTRDGLTWPGGYEDDDLRRDPG